MPIMMSFSDFMHVYNMVDQDQKDHREALDQQAVSTGTAGNRQPSPAKITRSSSSSSSTSSSTPAATASSSSQIHDKTTTKDRDDDVDPEEDIEIQADFLFHDPSQVMRRKAVHTVSRNNDRNNNPNTSDQNGSRTTRRIPLNFHLKRKYTRTSDPAAGSSPASSANLVNGQRSLLRRSNQQSPSLMSTPSPTLSTSSLSTNNPFARKQTSSTPSFTSSSHETSSRSPGKRRLLPNRRLLETESDPESDHSSRKKKRTGPRILYPLPRTRSDAEVASASATPSSSKSSSSLCGRIFLCGESFRRSSSRVPVRILLDLEETGIKVESESPGE